MSSEENVLLNFILRATDLASGPMKGFGANAKAVAEGASTAFLGIGAAAAVVAVESMNLAEKYDTSLRKVYALTGITADQFEAMKTKILDLSTIVPKSATELADAMYVIASEGYRGADAMSILKMGAEAATAGLTDTTTVVKATTAVLAAYKMTGAQAGEVTDIITQAVTQGNVQFGDLAGSFGRILPFSSSLGVSFGEVAANMATMTRIGLSADQAATALQGTLAAMVHPSSAASKAANELGLSFEQMRQDIQSKGLLATLQEIMNKTGGNTVELSKLFPNIRALKDILATAGSQGEAYAGILGSMKDAVGLTDEAFKKTAEGSAVQIDLLKNQLSAIAIEIGEKLLPKIVDFAKWARELVVRIEDWVKQNPELAKFVLIAVGIGVALSAISLVIGPLVTLLAGLAAVFTGPLLLAVLGIGVAVVGLKKLWDTNFNGIQEKTKSVTDNIGSFLGGVKKGFEDQTTKTIPDYGRAYDTLRDGAVNPFRESVLKLTDSIYPLSTEMDQLTKQGNDWARSAEKATEKARLWEDRGRKLGEAIAWLWEKVLQPLAGWLVDAFLANVERVIQGVTDLITAIQNAIEIGKLIGSAVGGAVKGAQNALGNLLGGGGAAAAAPQIYRPGEIPMFGGGGFMDHDGLAFLHAGEQIRTPQQQQSRGERQTIHTHIYLKGKEIAEAVSEEFVTGARLAGRSLG